MIFSLICTIFIFLFYLRGGIRTNVHSRITLIWIILRTPLFRDFFRPCYSLFGYNFWSGPSTVKKHWRTCNGSNYPLPPPIAACLEALLGQWEASQLQTRPREEKKSAEKISGKKDWWQFILMPSSQFEPPGWGSIVDWGIFPTQNSVLGQQPGPFQLENRHGVGQSLLDVCRLR